MCFSLFLICLLLKNVSGQKLLDGDTLQSVWKELDVLKRSLEDFRELTIEMKDIKAHTNALENEVEELKQDNVGLHSKVLHLETQVKQMTKHNENYSSILKKNYVSNESVDEVNLLKNDKAIIAESEEKNAGKRKRRASVGTQVAFSAAISAPDLVGLGYHQTIIFDTAITNVGNAYHPYSGIFLAPVTGVYVFSVTLMVTRGHSQYLEIVINGATAGDVYCGATLLNETVSSMRQWIFEVNEGSDVWIRTGNRGQVRGYMHSDFSGFLLYEKE